MSSLILSGNTSGTVTLEVPDVSGSNTITVPASTSTLALQTDIMGINQTWQSVTRTNGTTYTNTTGKPIMISGYASAITTAGVMTITVAGAISSRTYNSVASFQGTAIIPAGATYSVSFSGSSPATVWTELR